MRCAEKRKLYMNICQGDVTEEVLEGLLKRAWLLQAGGQAQLLWGSRSSVSVSVFCVAWRLSGAGCCMSSCCC